jgi:hypothetical protein
MMCQLRRLYITTSIIIGLQPEKSSCLCITGVIVASTGGGRVGFAVFWCDAPVAGLCVSYQTAKLET